jgi:hypothetical protein
MVTATDVTFLTVAVSSRSWDQDRSPGLGAGGTTSIIGYGMAVADLVSSDHRPPGVLVDRQPIR